MNDQEAVRPTSNDQWCQFYLMSDMAHIYNVSRTTIGRNEGGVIRLGRHVYDLPYRASWTDNTTTKPLWDKVEVWTALGLVPSANPFIKVEELLTTDIASKILGISTSMLTEMVRRNDIRAMRSSGNRIMIPLNALEALVGHALFCWPKRKDDLAYHAANTPSPTQHPVQAVMPVAEPVAEPPREVHMVLTGESVHAVAREVARLLAEGDLLTAHVTLTDFDVKRIATAVWDQMSQEDDAPLDEY